MGDYLLEYLGESSEQQKEVTVGDGHKSSLLLGSRSTEIPTAKAG